MNAQGLRRLLVHLAVFALIYGFLLIYFTPSHLLSKTTITGGDTPSHYLTAHYLIHTLLPKYKIIGWMPGNYAGFPMFQFYFPLPFLIMAGLNLLMPLQIAFKLVSVLGIFLLPVCAFGCLRLLGFRFPAPITGAIFTLPFLFMEANSAWGGNIPSTLAGEFAYGIGFALLFVYLGLFYKGVTENKYAIANGVLLTLVGLCHACTLLFGVFAATFFLFTTDRFLEKTWYYLKVNALAFFLLGGWMIQLLWFMPYTTRFSFVWVIDGISQVFPPILLPVIALAIAGTGLTLVRRMRNKKAVEEPALKTQSPSSASAKTNPTHAPSPLVFLWFICLLATAFYFMAFKMNVVDIRFIPFIQFSLMLLGAVGIYYLMSRLKALLILPLFLAVVTVLIVNTQLRSIPSWVEWNYSGFEQKRVWPAFWALHEKLKGTCQDPRVVYEHDLKHRAAGSVRAFEMLPYFSGRSTLEGLYIQSTITSPFVFYVQSEISEKPSCPLPDYNYSRLNLEKGLQHLKLFNVSQLVVVTDKVRKTLSEWDEVVREADFPPYTIYRLRNNGDRYVSLLDNQPVLLVTRDWQQEAFQWFRKSDLKTFVAFKEQLEPGDKAHFKTIIHGKLPDALPVVPVFPKAPHPNLLSGNGQALSGKDPSLESQDEYKATRQANQGRGVIKEIIRPEEIVIETENIGLPHLVRVSYHPNWHVEGADRIYLVSPSFMLIYPTQERVRLYFGPSFPNYLGYALSFLGVLFVIGYPLLGHRFRICGSRLENSTKLESQILDRVEGSLPRRLHDLAWKKRLLRATVITMIGTITAFILVSQQNDATIMYNKGLAHYTQKDYGTARKIFEKAMKSFPYSPIIDQTLFHYAAAYFREEKWQEALEAFEQMASDYPETRKLSEVLYHIGICKMKLHRPDEAVLMYKRILEEFPDDRWAGFAKDRLKEIRKISPQRRRVRRELKQ
jgi:tetratricopeptide (TPR) repeat protein